MAQLPPDPLKDIPSTDIDVTDLSLISYTAVIEWIHARDLERAGNNLYHGVPLASKTPGWRRINLTHPGLPTLSLLINEVDGYLTGIRRGDGEWMYFDDLRLPYGVQGIPLGLKSSYLKLMKPNESIHLRIGKPILKNCYHVLVNFDGTLNMTDPRWRSQRKALPQMIVMLCEATRINPILQLIYELMDREDSVPMPPNMWEMAKNWSTLSAFCRYCQRMEIDERHLEQEKIDAVSIYGVRSREDVLGVLRLIFVHSGSLT